MVGGQWRRWRQLYRGLFGNACAGNLLRKKLYCRREVDRFAFCRAGFTTLPCAKAIRSKIPAFSLNRNSQKWFTKSRILIVSRENLNTVL